MDVVQQKVQPKISSFELETFAYTARPNARHPEQFTDFGRYISTKAKYSPVTFSAIKRRKMRKNTSGAHTDIALQLVLQFCEGVIQ